MGCCLLSEAAIANRRVTVAPSMHQVRTCEVRNRFRMNHSRRFRSNPGETAETAQYAPEPYLVPDNF
jgi:hypothetical protein